MRLAAVLMMLAGPVAAQGQFALPAGCEGYVTIQKRGCMVTHNFICAGDPEGHQQRIDLDEGGAFYLARIDAETQWIESFNLTQDFSSRLGPVIEDAASFSELLETGVDSWNFSTTDNNGTVTVFQGFDRLTGETVAIDGVTLERTEYDMVARSVTGIELWRSTGAEFINRDWRAFLSGTRNIVTPDDDYDTDNTPVEFAFPGEEGFLATRPKFDCGAILSSYEVTQ